MISQITHTLCNSSEKVTLCFVIIINVEVVTYMLLTILEQIFFSSVSLQRNDVFRLYVDLKIALSLNNFKLLSI